MSREKELIFHLSEKNQLLGAAFKVHQDELQPGFEARPVTWCFTPTGIGVKVVARHASGAELDVTDYGSW
jgi:hypothetical protein